MEIRTMLPEDLSQAAALEAACFGSDAWSEQALEQALSDKNALYLSCMEEGRLIACCGIWQSFEAVSYTHLKGTSTAFVGDLANFIIGCSFLLPASIIYLFRKNKKNAIIGCVVGTLVMTVFGTAFNAVYLLPKFAELYGMPLDSIVGLGHAINPSINSVTTLALFAVAPMNLMKGGIVSCLLYTSWLLDGDFMRDRLVPSPIPQYDHHYSFDPGRHFIRYVYHINRDNLFEDLFRKLAQ